MKIYNKVTKEEIKVGDFFLWTVKTEFGQGIEFLVEVTNGLKDYDHNFVGICPVAGERHEVMVDVSDLIRKSSRYYMNGQKNEKIGVLKNEL